LRSSGSDQDSTRRKENFPAALAIAGTKNQRKEISGKVAGIKLVDAKDRMPAHDFAG
jgi:hypothetical protein